MKALVKGAGVAGLTLAHELAARGASVTVVERRRSVAGNASWHAGGMLAPWCERESAEDLVLALGQSATDWWDAVLPGHVVRAGTLVVAPARDAGELDRFARRTSGFSVVDGEALAALEPDLRGRFRRALFFAGEAHLDPRRAMLGLTKQLAAMGVRFEFGYGGVRLPAPADIEIDCTGIAAQSHGLRGVRGEMLLLRTRDVALIRPVRLLHPRFPVYIVPRADHLFMVGATMIENDSEDPVTARSVMELLGAAYTLHPAFGEAQIIEIGAGVRPAFADNLPRVERSDNDKLSINGLYRHGFLLAPAMARQAAGMIFDTTKKEHRREAHH